MVYEMMKWYMNDEMVYEIAFITAKIIATLEIIIASRTEFVREFVKINHG